MARAAISTVADLLATGRPLALPGVHDALAARLAAEAGFEAIFLSGYGFAATHLGQPDFGLTTGAEVLDAARRVVAAVDRRVIVDVDTGYGGPFNVEHTVDALLRAGAAGCFLEDQVWPKRCGHMERKRVLPLDEYLPKLRAALQTRAGTGFHVTARTDARGAVGLDEAIRRARAFADAGADAVFVEAPESIDEMARIREAVPANVTLVANMVDGGKTPLRTLAELGAAGYRIVVFPIDALVAATRAMRDVFAALRRDGSTRAVADRLLPFAEMNRLLGVEERYRREREWLDPLDR
ncbi:MAG TPA: oxaloacetate decarboxylase [Candidatus Binatia bacterium]|nr:oxaloacetate decarboxylase [Candidatus Binatia bacterium]